MGCRDYAILLLLARLGLRSGEVTFLELDDIDWKAGKLSVRGKSGQRSELPLPAEVGEAIAAYLRRGRPQSANRRVFLRAKAPIRGFQGQSGVGSIVRHCILRVVSQLSRHRLIPRRSNGYSPSQASVLPGPWSNFSHVPKSMPCWPLRISAHGLADGITPSFCWQYRQVCAYPR